MRLLRDPAKIIWRILTGDSQFTWKGMSAPPGGDAAGLIVEHVIDNGQIMRRQIPDDVDVVPKKAQVDADGIDVIKVAQFPVFHQLFDSANRGIEKISVVDHEDSLFSSRQIDQVLGLLGGGGQRFFHQHMKAGFEAARCQGVVSGDRSRDGHRIDPGFQQLIYGLDEFHRPIGPPNRL